VGVTLIAAGALAGDWWLALLGVLTVIAAPLAILIGATQRHSRPPAPRDKGYSDNFVGGSMTVLGFKPSEQEEARRERAERRPD
jgi:uncharacterized membrane protein